MPNIPPRNIFVRIRCFAYSNAYGEDNEGIRSTRHLSAGTCLVITGIWCLLPHNGACCLKDLDSTNITLQQQQKYANSTIEASTSITAATHHRTKVPPPLKHLYRGRASNFPATVQDCRRPWLRLLPFSGFFSRQLYLVSFKLSLSAHRKIFVE